MQSILSAVLLNVCISNFGSREIRNLFHTISGRKLGDIIHSNYDKQHCII